MTHRHDLRISTTGSAALDAKGRSLAGLADACEGLLAQRRAEGLGKANGCGRLALAEWCGIYSSANDVVAIGGRCQTIAYRQRYLGLGVAPLDHLVFVEAGSGEGME